MNLSKSGKKKPCAPSNGRPQGPTVCSGQYLDDKGSIRQPTNLVSFESCTRSAR